MVQQHLAASEQLCLHCKVESLRRGKVSALQGRACGLCADPQCVACGTSSRMKCIWLNDAEFSFLRYQPWQCLRCAVNRSFEAGQQTAEAARRNLCIWFTRVTRLKANYTELQCKVLPAQGQADVGACLGSAATWCSQRCRLGLWGLRGRRCFSRLGSLGC